MAINYDELLKNEAFTNIENERKQAFIQLAKDIEGKNFNETMDIIIKFSKNMPKGKKISNKEKQAMIMAITSSLPEEEKSKFKSILKVMETMK